MRGPIYNCRLYIYTYLIYSFNSICKCIGSVLLYKFRWSIFLVEFSFFFLFQIFMRWYFTLLQPAYSSALEGVGCFECFLVFERVDSTILIIFFWYINSSKNRKKIKGKFYFSSSRRRSCRRRRVFVVLHVVVIFFYF